MAAGIRGREARRQWRAGERHCGRTQGRFCALQGDEHQREIVMALLKLAALGTLGYLAYKYLENQKSDSPAAFAAGQPGGDNFAKVRDAGPAAMATKPQREWSIADEQSDQSFPASDPPANY
jgi:uncharacterized membrane protein YebE (DUF533 family)